MAASSSGGRFSPPRGDPAAQALVQSIVDLCDDAIVTCDPEGAIVTWSPTAERLFGRSAAAVLGRPLHSLFPEHLRPGVHGVMATALAGDAIRHFESEVLRPDGMAMPVSMSFGPVHEPSAVTAVVVVARDVTEQHLAQATLAEVERRLEAGEVLAHVGIWLWDLRTGVVQWSAEFHRIHGLEPSQFDGTVESHLALVHPDDRDEVRAAMEHAVATARPFEREYRVVPPGTAVRIVRVRAEPEIASAGEVVGLRGLGQMVAR